MRKVAILDDRRLPVVLAASLALGACGQRPEQRELPPITRGEPVEPRTPEGDAIEYTLRFPAPHTHYVEVEAVFPTGGADPLELMMAVWTPGSYLVREYSRNVEALTAATLSGDPLAIDKTRKNRWRVATDGADRIALRYRVYAHEISVRTNFIAAELAVINGAPTFITLADAAPRPHDVALELPPTWKHTVTGMAAHPDGAPHHYLAADFDTLVDSPIVAGNPALHEFEVEGVAHVLANFGGGLSPETTVGDGADPGSDPGADGADGVDGVDDAVGANRPIWDSARSAADVATIARAHIDFWRNIPYSRYVFLNVLTGGGGLEHKNSTLIMMSPWATRTRKDYVRWLGLVSHEFFHTWNVKRLRPAALGPFDYESENYTRSLWVAEGVTSYYDDLLLARAGLIDRDEYLDTLSEQIKDVQTTPGRAVQPLSQASFDAWIKYYRPDENSRNTSTNYYRKGAVVGFLLDAEIRRVTRDQRSLDDVMRLAYERHAGERGYTPEQFRAVIDEVAGTTLGELLRVAVDSTDELDYEPALRHFGLQFEPTGGDGDAAAGEGAAGEGDRDDETPGWLGADVDGQGRVVRLSRDTPAYEAGINVADEILAIDEYRVAGDKLDERLARYRPDDRVSILVARRGRLVRVPVQLGRKPDATWKLQVVSRPTRLQKRRLDVWLSPPR